MASTSNRSASRLVVALAGACWFVALLPAAAGAAADTDGLSQVAGPSEGSSEPTYTGTQRRLAVTGAGRTLAVHGLHAAGVGLAWRDPAGNWQTRTTGEVLDGKLLPGTQTGDWPASIAIARDTGGEEHAWVVFAKRFAGGSSPQPLYMRRLSDLDSPSGPRVGPLTEVDAPALGAYMPDIAFGETAAGDPQGYLIWSRQASNPVYETVAASFTDLDSDQPLIEGETVIDTGTSSRWGTLVPGAEMKVVGRWDGELKVFSRSATDPPTWLPGPAGVSVSAQGFPSATALDSGELVSAVESSTATVSVQRLTSDGTRFLPPELTLRGYSAPTIASDGARIWIVMIRQSDGFVVSRQFVPGLGWDTVDRVEIGAEGGGSSAYPYDHPNLLRRTDGRLRLIVGLGSESDPQRSSVLAFQRGLDDPIDSIPPPAPEPAPPAPDPPGPEPQPPVADIDSPDTTITAGAPRRTRKARVTFRFRSDEAGSSFECKLDARQFRPCGSPQRFRVKTGRHRFLVRATDATGNLDPTPASRKFTVVG